MEEEYVFIKVLKTRKALLEDIERDLTEKPLAPFEYVEIIADKGGRPGVYIIHRSSKRTLSDDGISYTR
jgi:hypothetical protein